ncbi:MAG: hypothetical protein OSA42_06975 [Porticoccaceae bacterium]|nr:hypothetical protein [Porticoccaceae bacterium]
MKQSKTLIASAMLIALGMVSSAIAERPPECDQGEATLAALGINPMELMALEDSMQAPPDGAPEAEHEAFDEMMDQMVADTYFEGDMEKAEELFDSLPDIDPMDCYDEGMPSEGKDHGPMDGMDHGPMDGMDHGPMDGWMPPEECMDGSADPADEMCMPPSTGMDHGPMDGMSPG